MRTVEGKQRCAQKLAIFDGLFCGRRDVHGTYDPRTGRSWQVKRPVTTEVVLDHLRGRRPYGVYLLIGDRTRSLAVDFDSGDLEPVREFLSAARHYGVPAYVERSKSKGHHIWVFFEERGVPASKARRIAQHILDEIGLPGTEVFPKQDKLKEGQYGNFINVPLFGRLVPEGRTIFLDEHDLRPCKNQWEFLGRVRRASESTLDDLIEINGLDQPVACSVQEERPGDVVRPKLTFGLPPCAQRALAEGVKAMQRIVCFRLAVHFHRVGIPLDITRQALRAWAAKNDPVGGKRVITDREILEQASYAYRHGYRGYGCAGGCRH